MSLSPERAQAKKLARIELLERKERDGICNECHRPRRKGRQLCVKHGTRRTYHQGRYACSLCGQCNHNRQRCPTREV